MKEKMGAVLRVVAVAGLLFGQVATSGVTSAEEQGKKPEVLPEGVYLVKDHDTLWAIAGRFLENPRLWPEVWKQNPFITNPDLIFPGDPLIIPGLTGPPKPVAEAPPVPEERVTPPPAPEPEVALPLEEEPIPVQEGGSLAEAQYQRGEGAIRVPEHARTPIIPRGELECSGYVAEREEIHTVGSIKGSAEAYDVRFSYWDEVFVDLGGRQVQQGDRFHIIRPTRTIRHPVTGRTVGIKVRTLGTVEIVDPVGSWPRARIVYSCEDIAHGDALVKSMPLEVPVVGMSRPTNIKQGGYIVASKSDADALGQGDIVYVDVGQAEQIVPGDEFAIYKRAGRRTAAQIRRGDLVVVRTTAKAAAAVVTRSDLVLREGERIVLLRKMP